jgi:hypothetical protein
VLEGRSEGDYRHHICGAPDQQHDIILGRFVPDRVEPKCLGGTGLVQRDLW